MSATTAVRTRRWVLVLVALAVLLVVTLVVSTGLGRLRSSGAAAEDSDVLVQDVSVQQTDPSYTVESVRAVVQGDRAFLAVRITWPDDPRDGASVRATPVLSGTVLHRGSSTGLETICGADPNHPVPDTSEGTVLPCTGILVPQDVTSVALRD